MTDRDKTRPPFPEGASGPGVPAGTASSGKQDRPDIGDIDSGKRNLRRAETGKTDPLAPEARGGAGAGRRWSGDS